MKSAAETRASIDNLADSLDKLTEATAEASEDSKQSIYYLSEIINKLIDQKTGLEVRALTEEVAKLRSILFEVLKFYTESTKTK